MQVNNLQRDSISILKVGEFFVLFVRRMCRTCFYAPA